MLHEVKAKSVIRKIIRKAKQDWTVLIKVHDPFDGDSILDYNRKEKDLIDAVFSVDISELVFLDMTTGKQKGAIQIVLEYDRPADEIISDHSSNSFINYLVN